MSLARIIERWAGVQPEKVALHFHGEDISYARLWQRIEAATLRLASLGVERGDRVAWLGANHPEMLAILFALARLGAMLVPLNFRLAPPEHEAILRHADAGILILDADFHGHGETLAKSLPLLKMVGLKSARKDWFAWDGPLPGGFTPRMHGAHHDPVLVVYTSGTTGKPKGAVHTQSALIWNAVNATHFQDLARDDHVLTVLPLFHVGGLCIQTIPALHAGATVTLHARFDAGAWLADVEARKPTLSLLVPATMKAVIQHPGWPGTDISSLRMIGAGSSTIPDNLIQAFHARGVPVGNVYGASETGPVSIYLRREDAMARVGSAGKVATHCDVRLVDAGGNEVAQGEVGEIWVRGLNLMQGYWKDPGNPSFTDGWFRSGDLARQDADGYYTVVGRSKDLVISGGENIYPAELENVLSECADILEATVLGVADSQWGEVAVAAIVRKPGSALDEAGVLRLFEGRLARYKHPRRAVFLETIPKTALGKVQKQELARLLGGA